MLFVALRMLQFVADVVRESSRISHYLITTFVAEPAVFSCAQATWPASAVRSRRKALGRVFIYGCPLAWMMGPTSAESVERDHGRGRH